MAAFRHCHHRPSPVSRDTLFRGPSPRLTRCSECGAEIAGDEACLARFQSLLAAEVDNEELRKMHGLTVPTYHLQHPSLTKPWFQRFGADVFQRVFGQGEDWGNVLMETHPRRIGRRADLAVARLKAAGGSTM